MDARWRSDEDTRQGGKRQRQRGERGTYLLGFHYPLVSLGLDGSSVEEKANTMHFHQHHTFPALFDEERTKRGSTCNKAQHEQLRTAMHRTASNSYASTATCTELTVSTCTVVCCVLLCSAGSDYMRADNLKWYTKINIAKSTN